MDRINNQAPSETDRRSSEFLTIFYIQALAPLALITIRFSIGKLPRWAVAIYIYSFITCALGWQSWYMYGLVGRLPVDARRTTASV